MFQRLGEFVGRRGAVIVVAWAAALLLLSAAPDWLDVSRDGEFIFLPKDSASRKAAAMFREARLNQSGLQDPLSSSIVIVVRREDRVDGQGLWPADVRFIREVLKPRLTRIAQTIGKGYEELSEEERAAPLPRLPRSERLIDSIWSGPPPYAGNPSEHVMGSLLQSDNEKSALVIAEMRTEFLDRSNNLIVSEVERLLNSEEIKQKKPAGLALDLSGSAVVGRDVLRAEQESGSRTERFTIGLVIVLLLLIYRAPLLAMIPLVAVGVSVEITHRLLAQLAGWGWIDIFTGLDIFVTVVVYGAGVDYCLFLIARYREELDHGLSFSQSIATAVERVGPALTASAATSILGIGMMAFARFGKFHQAGIAISLGLFVGLLAAATFTPALLHLTGRWAFWPDLRRERLEARAGWLPTLSLAALLSEQPWLKRGWSKVAEILRARPGQVFFAAVLMLLPFAVVGVAFHNHLSYGLLTDLPKTDPSVVGAKAVQKHFPAGITGPTTILLHNPAFELTGFSESQELARQVSEHVHARAEALGIADVRSQAYPLGMTSRARELDATFDSAPSRRAYIQRVRNIYTSREGPLAGDVMRLDLVFNQDPFLRDSIGDLDEVEATILDAVPEEFRAGTTLHALGPTASLRDLKQLTDRDRMLIDVLVVAVVYVILIALLRRPAICAYLILTVVFSYLAALGGTWLVFWMLDPGEFAGLDWKIPLFLFTILIAMGEDYNILLMARVQEEQERHGLLEGVLVALTRTGSIISSCGVIMAGTFASLMSGTLMGMVQMGCALALGVMIDTFIVRPILVPAWLILLYEGRFGVFGRWFGAVADGSAAAPGFAASVHGAAESVPREAAPDSRSVQARREREGVEDVQGEFIGN
jgi:RND superfamily putative drug exporter